MARPRTIPTWATDANYTATDVTDPHHGTPTKVEPNSGTKANGLEPRWRPPAQNLNWLFHAVSRWVEYLALIPLVNWSVRQHATDGSPTGAVAVASRPWVAELDAFIAIFNASGGGRAQRSTDGVHWVDLSGGITGALFDVAWMGGSVNLWLIAAATGTIWTHPPNDTGSWTARGPGSGANFRAVAVNDNATLAVAVGNGGRIFTSTNGTTWTSRTSGTANDLLDVSYGGGLWVAVGDGLTILTSTDGTTWTVAATGTGSITHTVYDPTTGRHITVSTGGVVATVDAPAGTVTSSVGTVGTTPPAAIATDGDGTIVVLTSGVCVSTDGGVTWSAERLDVQGRGVLTSWGGMTYSASLGCYLAAGEDGASPSTPLLAQSLRTA